MESPPIRPANIKKARIIWEKRDKEGVRPLESPTVAAADMVSKRISVMEYGSTWQMIMVASKIPDK